MSGGTVYMTGVSRGGDRSLAAGCGTARPGFVACPVHPEYQVAYEGAGLLLGVCPECALDAALGLKGLRRIANEGGRA